MHNNFASKYVTHSAIKWLKYKHAKKKKKHFQMQQNFGRNDSNTQSAKAENNMLQ